MKISKCVKESFTVIGKEGSTNDGDGFIARLWEDANGHFSEVAHLAKKDGKGNLAGIWGAMSDFSRSFLLFLFHFLFSPSTFFPWLINLQRVCISPGLNVRTGPRLLTAGPNGSYQDMNICMWKMRESACSQR